MAELADPTPQFVASGGMDKLVRLACRVGDGPPAAASDELVLEDAPMLRRDELELSMAADPLPTTVLVVNELVLEDAPAHEVEALEVSAGASVADFFQVASTASVLVPGVIKADLDTYTPATGDSEMHWCGSLRRLFPGD